jgi:hypothetical protein
MPKTRNIIELMGGWLLSGSKRSIFFGLAISLFLAGCAEVKANPAASQTAIQTSTTRSIVEKTPEVVVPNPRNETAAPTFTITATPSKTLTLTPFPTWPPFPSPPPFTGHVWSPAPVLISFGHHGGDGGGLVPLEFTLLGNRKLYVFDWSSEKPLFETTLTRKAVCQLLNTIDQTGFFEYQHEDYDLNPSFYWNEGVPDYEINIYAWKDVQVIQHALPDFLEGEYIEFYETCEECGPPPPLSPALVSTYRLLESYRPESLLISPNQSIAIFIREFTEDSFAKGESVPWPDNLPSLAEIKDHSSCEYETIATFTGETANNIEKFLRQNFEFFSINSRYFRVYYTKIIPEAVYTSCTDTTDYYTDAFSVPDLHHNLACSPEDGVLPIPEP